MFKRIVITKPGGPEVLQPIEEPIPLPQPGEVRIKVLAAGAAYGDVVGREGIAGADLIPDTPGYDVVGVIDALGEGVEQFKIGQMVAAFDDWNGYTEMTCRSANMVVPLHDSVDPAEAVALVLNGLTAYQMLHRVAHLQPGEKILIHGAGGGVGTLLLQLGKLAGLEMFATASSSKHALIQELGGIPIDYRSEDFVSRIKEETGSGVDAVFDGIGGTHWERSYQALQPGGRLVVYGRMSVLNQGQRDEQKLSDFYEQMPDFSPLRLFRESKSVMGYYITPYNEAHRDHYHADLTTLFDLLKKGQIKPIIGAKIPLLEVARAHELLNNAAVSGKIVLLANQ